MTDEQNPAPTPAQAQEVSQAAGTAIGEGIQAGETPEQVRERANAAITQTAEKVDFKLSDEDRDGIVDTLIERMQALGAFDPPPPPEAAPAVEPPVGDPPPPADSAAPPAAEAEPPRKKTFAEKFAGI